MSKRIDVIGENIYYGDFLAVKDVNVVIEPKSVTALIGPSGCGKSTFLRTLNRMHETIPGARVEGQVIVDGVNLYGPGVDAVQVRRAIGMVFQRPNPFPTMSIAENVLAGVRLNNRRIKKSDADDLVEASLRGKSSRINVSCADLRGRESGDARTGLRRLEKSPFVTLVPSILSRSGRRCSPRWPAGWGRRRSCRWSRTRRGGPAYRWPPG